MPSLSAIFCRFRRLLPLAGILLSVCFALPRPAAAQPAVYLGRDTHGRQLFRIDSLTAALSPGDRLGPCVVSEKGLDCPPSAAARTKQSGAASAKASCAARLRHQEKRFQARYLRSLEQYTENLRRKNYQLVEASRQLQELRARLGKEGENGPTAGRHKNGVPSAAAKSGFRTKTE